VQHSTHSKLSRLLDLKRRLQCSPSHHKPSSKPRLSSNGSHPITLALLSEPKNSCMPLVFDSPPARPLPPFLSSPKGICVSCRIQSLPASSR
jgi:hypothetical protein